MTTGGEGGAEAPEALVVYWRPGCGYCYRLLDVLEEAGVRMRLYNIWEDEAAREVVAQINGGNETVPTVLLGDRAAPNPPPEELLELLRVAHPHLLASSAAPTEGGER